jgi:hypothetical protein
LVNDILNVNILWIKKLFNNEKMLSDQALRNRRTSSINRKNEIINLAYKNSSSHQLTKNNLERYNSFESDNDQFTNKPVYHCCSCENNLSPQSIKNQESNREHFASNSRFEGMSASPDQRFTIHGFSERNNDKVASTEGNINRSTSETQQTMLLIICIILLIITFYTLTIMLKMKSMIREMRIMIKGINKTKII